MGKLTARIRLPWWWRIYISAIQAYAAVGGFVDPDFAADFIVRHTRIDVIACAD